jgi:glycosyltransferase involved in cell wall biosynthesis
MPFTSSYRGGNNVVRHATDIWLLLDSLTFGGIESYVLELAKGLKQQGQVAQVVLLSKHDEESLLIDKLKQANIRFRYLHQLVDAQPSTSLPTLTKQLFMASRKHKPRVIHAHGYKASIINKLTPHRANTVVTYHSGETPKGRVWLYDFIDRYTAGLATHNLTVSAQISLKIPYSTTTLNNFIAVNNVQLSTGKQVAFVGRLSHEKGPDQFVSLAATMPDTEFHLYGDGPMRSEITLQSGSNVHLMGFASDMDEAWSNIGLLVISSRFEGLAMTAIEAMARGIPVVSTQVGAMDSLIAHDVNGWLVDSPDQLAQFVKRWQELTPKQLKKISASARQTVVDEFSSEAVVTQLLNHYAIG